MRRKTREKIHSLFAILLIFFQSASPTFLLVSPVSASEPSSSQHASEITLGLDTDSNQLILGGESSVGIEYVLSYDSENPGAPTRGVYGSVETIGGKFEEKVYAGTCSTNICVPDQISHGKLVLPDAGYTAPFEIQDSILWLEHEGVATVAQVQAGTRYVAPQNPEVSLTFTELPNTPGTLSIQEVTLSEEQVAATGAVSNIAYDITSSMENGTFEYDLKLPLPEGNAEPVRVVYAKSVDELSQSRPVDSVTTTDSVEVKNLNHFTVYIVVQPQDTAKNITDVFADSSSWFFYNDETDVIDDSLGSFVAGPATAPLGDGSAQISVVGTERRNLATYQFGGVVLADITELGFSTFNPSAGNGGSANRSAYLHFNVDFDGSDTWQSRLIFTPPSGDVVQDSWQAWDAIAGNTALWYYSDSNWPVTGEPGTTAKTWAQILSDYPSARILEPNPWLGIRVGSPYADGYTENIDAFVFGTAVETTTFNFEPLLLTAPTNLGWNTRSSSATAGERAVDVVCGGATNGDFLAYGNGQIAHNWSTTDTTPDLKFQRQYSWPGSGVWSTDPTIYTTTNTNFGTLGSSAGTEGSWNTRVRSWFDLNENSSLDEATDAVSAWSNECAVTYDRTAPSAPSHSSPADGAFTTTAGLTKIDWSDVVDVGSSISYVYQSSLSPTLNIDGSFVSPAYTSGSLSASEIPTAGTPEGKYYWHVRAQDAAGNTSAWSTAWSVVVDSTAPDVEITAPTSMVVSGTVPIRGTVTDVNPHHYYLVVKNSSNAVVAGPGTVNDSTSFTDKLFFNWDTTLFPEGTYTIRLEARDAANNKDAGSVAVKTVVVDRTSPTPDLVFAGTGPSFTSFDVVFSEDVNQAEAENPANYFLNNWPGAGGSGNLVGDAIVAYNSSTKTATVTLTNPGWYVSPEQEWGVQDIHDLAGNVQSTNPYTETSTPMIAPVTTDTGTDTSWHGSAVTVTLTCDDNTVSTGSGCKTTYYTTDGSDPTTLSTQGNSVVVSAEGETTIKYFSVDNAGNTEAVKTAANTVKIDATKPSSIITSYDLGNGGSVETATFSGLLEGTATDSASGVDYVLLAVSHLDFGADTTDIEYWDATASAWTSTPSTFRATGTTAWSYSLSSVPEGTYNVTSHAVDLAGNVESTYTIRIVYDKTIPEVVLVIDPTSPDGDNGWYRNTKPSITLTASDNYSLDHIEYQWNSTVGLWSTYSSAFNPPGEGQYILYYRSIDTVGNVSDTGIKEVKYDATKPEQSPNDVRVENISSPTADGLWSAPSITSDIANYKLVWRHEDGTSHSTTVRNSTFKHQLTDLYDGLWTFAVRAIDSAGNYNESKIEFRVGPDPAATSATGEVLGVTTTGVGGTTGLVGNVLAAEEVAEETQTEEVGQSDDAASEGAVLGVTTCSPWSYYLPLVLLLLQLIVLVGYEVLRRDALGVEILVSMGVTAALIGLFYVLRDPSCYSEGSWVALIAQWFTAISILFAVGVKALSFAFIDSE